MKIALIDNGSLEAASLRNLRAGGRDIDHITWE